MCVSPKKIYNRSNHWDEFKPLYLYVPCGKCEECRQQNRNDWFVRCFYEWSNNTENGHTFFYTLTYNNENLPTFCGRPCFSKRHIQLFIKRLRFVLDKTDTKLRYMVTSEYGELKGRSHYHALFFLNKYTNPYMFLKLVQECWSYGFVKTGDNVGIVNSYNGIQYVTKYVTKDFSHLHDFLDEIAPSYADRANKFIKRLNSLYGTNIDVRFSYRCSDRVLYYTLLRGSEQDYSFDELDEIKRIFLYFRRFITAVTPFHLQSTGLGLGMLHHKHVSFEHEYAMVMKSNCEIVKYRLPRYLRRKMWYDCVENEVDGKRNRYILNRAGKEHYLSLLPEKVAKTKLEYQSTLLNTDSKLVTKDVLDLVNSALDKMKFYNVQSLQHYLHHIDVDLEILAIYSQVFRDRCNFIDDLVLTDDYVKGHYVQIADFHLSSVSIYDFGKVYSLYSHETERLKYSTFNYHPFFTRYEEVLTIMESYSLSLRLLRSEAKIKEQELIKKAKQLILQL